MHEHALSNLPVGSPMGLVVGLAYPAMNQSSNLSITHYYLLFTPQTNKQTNKQTTKQKIRSLLSTCV
jgi:hypothetical protein